MDGGYNGVWWWVASGNIQQLHSLDGTAFTLVAHVASSRKCNYMLSTYFAQQKHCQDLFVPNGVCSLTADVRDTFINMHYFCLCCEFVDVGGCFTINHCEY